MLSRYASATFKYVHTILVTDADESEGFDSSPFQK